MDQYVVFVGRKIICIDKEGVQIWKQITNAVQPLNVICDSYANMLVCDGYKIALLDKNGKFVGELLRNRTDDIRAMVFTSPTDLATLSGNGRITYWNYSTRHTT